MQRFIAELSRPVDKTDFDKSWKSDPAVNREPKTEFVFKGRIISVLVHSDPSAPWPSPSFRQTFSTIIRRIDGICNVRWL